MTEYRKIDSEESLKKTIDRARKAQIKYAEYSQEQVDEIFYAAAKAGAEKRIELAELAVSETGMGVMEDKVIKNQYASEYIYNAYKNTKTCGVIERNESEGLVRIAEPIGVIAAVIPTTNPTSTAIFKILLALKTRNAVILSPHPRAKGATATAAKFLYEAALEAGAPEDIIQCITEPSVALSTELMKKSDIVLATGGPAMVKAAYSSGKPAIGVGAGNTPVILHHSCDIKLAVNSIIHSKTFDNGVICASEQAVIVEEKIADAAKAEFTERGCYFLKDDELDKLRTTMFTNETLNAAIVGQSAVKIAEIAGITVPEDTKILIGEVDSVDESEEFSREKLSPILAFYRAKSFDDALDMADTLVKSGGYGHTSSIFIDEYTAKDALAEFNSRMKTSRILVNTPASHGAIGDLYNFRLTPSLTLGCGSWGGNSVSENVGIMHLLNVKTVAERRENMLWFRVPEKVFIKSGCLEEATAEIGEVYNSKKVFIVTDKFLFENGYTERITKKLDELSIKHTVFYDIMPDPTLASARAGAEQMRSFAPDCILAIGGGSPIDAAKIMWVLYEQPDADFMEMALRFADIRKRIYSYKKLGRKALFVAVPTSAGTGSEVTPFAVITDDESGIKYPLADYELLPDMAIVDPSLMLTMPKGLTAASGIDALTHSLEAYGSMLATDFTDALALGAMGIIFKYLPEAYDDGEAAPKAREKMANASTMAGMAFANAFLGVCHSMAHKLGAFHNLPHGVANALLINKVMEFNSSKAPTKMGTFPQYEHPHTLERYAEIADYLGLGGDSDEEKLALLLEKIDALKEKVGIKKTIKDYGIEEGAFKASLDEMSQLAFDDQCTGANPRYPLIEEIKEIYLSAYYG